MTDDDVQAWVELYASTWASREPGAKARVWHEDGRLHHPVLDMDIDGATVPRFDDNTKALIPDLDWRVQRWAAHGDVVFLEWSWTGTVNGTRVALEGVDRMVVRDGRIVEEAVYFDSVPLRQAVDPTLSAEPIVRAAEVPE